MKSKRYIHKIKNECNQKTNFIILCGRKSTKKGYKNIPLTHINNKQLVIDDQINTILNNYEEGNIIIVSGFENDKIVSHVHDQDYPNISIAENKDYKESNILEAWKFALNIAQEEDTYIIHGDRLFTDSCITNYKIKNSYTMTYSYSKNNYDLGLLSEDGKYINMSYGLPNVWSEIFFICKKDFKTVRKMINQYRQKKIYNIESFMNLLSRTINISVIEKTTNDIKPLKEIK